MINSVAYTAGYKIEEIFMWEPRVEGWRGRNWDMNGDKRLLSRLCKLRRRVMELRHIQQLFVHTFTHGGGIERESGMDWN